MIKDFNIPPNALLGFNTEEEKEEFVIEYVRKAISDELREMTKKHLAKAQQQKKFEKDLQRMKEKAEKDKSDTFQWLHVPTK